MTYADKAHFYNYDPSSYGWRIEPDLVPFVFKGVNFGSCARDVLPVFTALLTELEPHIPGGIAFGPHDDWAYSATDELPDGSPSFHHYGIAFDLNWRENPMGNYANNPYAGQRGAIPYEIAATLARKYGCEYGGTWSGGANRLGFKDYMHFECHLAPADARKVRVPTTKGLTMDKDVAAAFAAINKRLDSLPSSLWAQRFADPADPTGKRTYSAATYLVYGNLRAKQALAAAQDAGAAAKGIAVDAATVAADITTRVRADIGAFLTRLGGIK